ncbi:MAG: protein-L-isoaspartate(D-aspartate) O-methyltransferase [Elusimicrobia bacterium]|nr:protein-L-isoaspartate(D-aspartate) O-methyltransferase [Elusimicrobiota bacterium]
MLFSKTGKPITEEDWFKIRLTAINTQLVDRGVRNAEVLQAMREVPRHKFLPLTIEPALAYADRPLPIGHNQTISQPYINAYIAEKLELTGCETVLEIGAGSGYQAAVLARLAKVVVSLELVAELAQFAKENFSREGVKNVEVHRTDGFDGWMESAPYDRIVISAGVDKIPEALFKQLNCPGKLIAPVGSKIKQKLVLFEKLPDQPGLPKILRRELISVAFVPMRGEIEKI